MRLTQIIARPLLYSLYRFTPAPKTKFAVVTRGRTGSHFLLSLLDSHPAIRQSGEVIGEDRMRQPKAKAHMINRGPVSAVERAFTRQRLTESAVGVKFNYYQLEAPYGRKWGVDGIPAVYEYLKSRKDIKIIHLTRRNRLRVLVSFRIAARTNRYVVFDKNKLADGQDVSIRLDRDECIAEFEQIEAWERQYADAFRHHDMLEVVYEDLVDDTESQCERLLAFLGVRPRTLYSNTFKMNERSSASIISNYQELRDQFLGTEWEKYFAD